MSSEAKTKQAPSYNVGDRVLVTGTGRWWAGKTFNAVITDVRDDSVKVRYDDGGFKRFSFADFAKLAQPATEDKPAMRYGSQPFELDVDHVSPPTAQAASSVVSLIQTRLNEAVYRKDFKAAAALKDDLDTLQAGEVTLARLQADLASAIDKHSYRQADELTHQIHALTAILDAAAARSAVGGGGAGAALSAALGTATVAAAGAVAAAKGSVAPLPSLDGKAPLSLSASSSSGHGSSSSDRRPGESVSDVLARAGRRALGGGLAGAGAMALQVLLLFPLRSLMNYQYRYGGTFRAAVSALHSEGGARRFYRGLLPALVQAPLARFGDTASNTGILAILNSNESTANLPIGIKTLAASSAAAMFRILIMPVDTIKTVLQVDGQKGISALGGKFRANGPSVFFHGALAASAATFAGHYPWFAVFNALDANLPVPTDRLGKLCRSAGIGFSATLVSDTVSNSIRVIKTYRQTHPSPISYRQAVTDVIRQDGVLGLAFRGLKTRIVANGIQGLTFSVLWKHFDEQWLHAASKEKERKSKSGGQEG